jgi:hypothetical protein
MSRFIDYANVLITKEIAFGVAAVGTRSYMTCTGGEIVAWEYAHADSDGNILINIYNATTGTDIIIATVYTMPGFDLFWGLFSSGVVPSKAITDAECVYYLVDYV